MHIKHIKSSELSTINWSGGTTTQLAIYPKDADYKKLNFQFRISTATVEAEESIFTSLPNISRKLMILDGEIKIDHKHHHSKIIKKFEQDEFSGDWDTKSFGKAIDFNLMMNGKASGEIEAITIEHTNAILLESEFNYYGFYIYIGETTLSIQDKIFKVNKGDFINLYTENEMRKVNLQTTHDCELILCMVSY